MDMCNSVGESWIHYAKWKKPKVKGCILYNSICMVIWKGESMRPQYNSVVIMSCGWGESINSNKACRNFGNNGIVKWSVIRWLHVFIKAYGTVH